MDDYNKLAEIMGTPGTSEKAARKMVDLLLKNDGVKHK